MPRAISATTTARTQSTAMPARLLTRTTGSGTGCRSSPPGDSMVAALFCVLICCMSDLHGLSFFARSQHEARPVKHAVHDVQVTFDAVIHHLGLAIRANHDEDRRFAMLHLGRHLNVGLRAIIEDAHWAEVLVLAMDPVIEMHGLHRIWREFLDASRFGGFLSLPREVLLPFALLFVVRISKRQASNIIFRLGDKPEIIGAAIRRDQQVRIEAGALGLHDDDRGRRVAVSIHRRRDVPADGISDVRLADQFFSALQLNHANAKRRAYERGQPRAVGVQYAAVRTSSRDIGLRLPLLADFDRLPRGGCQFNIRLCFKILRDAGRGSRLRDWWRYR